MGAISGRPAARRRLRSVSAVVGAPCAAHWPLPQNHLFCFLEEARRRGTMRRASRHDAGERVRYLGGPAALKVIKTGLLNLPELKKEKKFNQLVLL